MTDYRIIMQNLWLLKRVKMCYKVARLVIGLEGLQETWLAKSPLSVLAHSIYILHNEHNSTMVIPQHNIILV